MRRSAAEHSVAGFRNTSLTQSSLDLSTHFSGAKLPSLQLIIMGASESKLVFKQGIFRLSEDKNIPADDPYWTSVSGPFKLPAMRPIFRARIAPERNVG